MKTFFNLLSRIARTYILETHERADVSPFNHLFVQFYKEQRRRMVVQ